MTDDRVTEPAWDATTTTSDETSPEVEALAEDIEQTRTEMTGTVEAIGERLDPSNIVEDAKETVREATVGKVEQMANTVADTASEFVEDARDTAQDAGSGLLETVKRNPIPAAMAGIGIGWLLMNRSSGSSSRRAVYGAASWPRDERDERGERYDRRHTDRSRGAVDQVGQQAGRIADDTRSAVGQVPDQVGGAVRDAQWNAQRMVEDNPLAVGAIAVAVGAAIGMALPETQTERRVLGPATEKAISTAEQTATDAVHELETANR